MFALWAAVDDQAVSSFSKIVRPQIQKNLTQLDQLAQTYGPGHGFTVAQASRYLKEIMQYNLDDPARAGLDRFMHEAVQIGLCHRDQAARAAACLDGQRSQTVAGPEHKV